jgi:hypothetical protein
MKITDCITLVPVTKTGKPRKADETVIHVAERSQPDSIKKAGGYSPGF